MTPDPVRVAARYKSKKKIETQDGDEATVYEYSERQIANRNRDKAEKVEHLRKNISDLRARVKDDLKDSDPMTRMTALAVSLLDETCERVGNEGSADDGHYGVTGWEARHVSFGKGKATIKYVGKSGVDHTKTVDDGPTVTALKELCEGRGKDEAIFDTDDAKVSADDVNDYLSEFDVTAKDIRGYRANDEMCKALRDERAKGPKTLPKGRKEKDEILKAEFKRALETVAEVVGHEAATLRSQYLVPGLEDQFIKDGTVLKSLKVGSGTGGGYPDLPDLPDYLSAFYRRHPSLGKYRSTPFRVVEKAAGGSHPEASTMSRWIEVYPKFWKLLDDPARDFVVAHELGHWVIGEYGLSDLTSLARSVGVDVWDRDSLPFSAINFDEAFADSFAEYHLNRAELVRRHPLWDRIVAAVISGSRVGTKTEAQREDEATEKLVKPSPKKKPPRHDLRNERVEVEKDPDLDTTDDDLSLNFKKVASPVRIAMAVRVAARYLRAKGVKMTTFDSKKSSAAIVKKQKAREKTKSDYDQAKNSVRDLPSEIKEAEDRITSESEDLKDEKSRLGKLEGLKDAASVRKKLIGETDSESRKKQIGDTSDNDLMKSHNSEVTKLKAKVSSRIRAIEKLKVTKAESQKKFEVADKRLSSLKGAFDKETGELNEMTAYHVSQEHLSSHLTDMSSLKSDSPKDRLSEAAKHLQSQPPEMRDKAIERSKARRDEKKKDLDNASSDEERAALQKEIDLADAELAAGTHDKYLRMTEKDAEKDTKASFIRSLHGSGIGADNEHVQTLLREDPTQSETAKAVYNLADKISDEDLMQMSDLGSAYETLKDYPNVMKALRGVLVGYLASDLKKDRAKKTDKANKAKVTPAKVKELAEAAKDLPEKDRETVQKVVRETATNLPAADRETVEDIFKLDIPDASTAPKGDQKEKGPSNPGEYRQMLLEGAGDEEARKKIEDLSSEDLNERWENYKSGKTARSPLSKSVARRFLAYSLTSR